MEKKYEHFPLLAMVLTVIIKLLFLLTHHIQEDAFITWRVAQNLLDYGVIGFNGDAKISASTTHLYVFVSYFFNLLFGKAYFIYPLLIFSSVLFTIGTFLLSKLLLKDPLQQALFIFLFGILPPAIKISILGMEYGILFFLYIGLLYFGFHHRKTWAFILFPALILFTRIDTVLFLGIVFLTDTIWHRKLNWKFISGGILGVFILLSFNYFYFHEWINNTIVAKKLTYEAQFTSAQNWNYFNVNYGNFWGMLKLPGNFNLFTIIVLLFELVSFIILVKVKQNRNYFLWIIFIFGWTKQLVFISQKSLFDWYYWIPQILLFVPVLILILEIKEKKYLWLSLLMVFYIGPMVAFQAVHSIATGNGEWNYRRNIGLFLDQYEKNKNEFILLEPAGYIPYFSHLKTIDETGLVDQGIQEEIKKDKKNYLLNTAKNRKPKYILSYKDLYQSENAAYYLSSYRLIKEFRIKDHLKSEQPLLQKIYHLKPSGTDYNLYQRK